MIFLLKSVVQIFLLAVSILFFCKGSSATTFCVAGVRLNKEVKNLKDLKREHVISQSLDYSCGAAGLSTLLNYYLEDPINEKEIIATLLQKVDLNKVKARKGFSLLDLKNFSAARGYKANGYKMDFDFLKTLGKPVLVPIKFKNFRHFVIVRAVIGDRVFLADPAVGNTIVKKETFNHMWMEGIGLVVEHRDENKNTDSSPLAVTMEEARVVDYRNVKRNLETSALRTTIHTDEWQ